jgi:hypothetical protein
LKEKLKTCLDRINLGLYGGRGTRDAIGLLKIRERTLDIDEEIFVLLHKMTAGISPYELDQINADPRGNW